MKAFQEPLKQLKESTQKRVCKLCFKDINPTSLFNLTHPNTSLCQNCFETLNFQPDSFIYRNTKITYLAKYEEPLSKLIIQYKELNDFELRNIFLERYSLILRLKYLNYKIVLVPSSKDNLKKRGFNHLENMVRILKLPILDILEKENIEQKTKNKIDRLNSQESFSLKEKIDLRKQKILLFDDIISTGASFYACLKLIRQLNPEKIEGLVIMRNKIQN